MGDASVGHSSHRDLIIHQPAPARRLQVYRNGDVLFPAKRYILNTRKTRTFDAFLEELTNVVGSKFGAVRRLYTPLHGTRVNSLEQLETKVEYVAAGQERFNHINYLSIEEEIQLKQKRRNREFVVIPVQHSRVQVSGRINKIHNEPIIIYVHPNGNDLENAHRVHIRPRDRRSMDTIYDCIMERVKLTMFGGAIRKLYTLDGKPLSEMSDIEPAGCYVAAGLERFIRRDYLHPKVSTMLSPTRAEKRPPIPRKLSPIKKKVHNLDDQAPSNKKQRQAPKEDVGGIPSRPLKVNRTPEGKLDDELEEPPMPAEPAHTTPTKVKEKQPFSSPNTTTKTNSKRPVSPPNATAKTNSRRPVPPQTTAKSNSKQPSPPNTTAKTNSVRKQRTPPNTTARVNSKTSNSDRTPVQPVDYDEDVGGVYRAKQEVPNTTAAGELNFDEDSGGVFRASHADTTDAEEVTETKDTIVDVPVDQLEAEQVAEELDTGLDEERDDKSDDPRKTNAATKIQSSYRGHRSRRMNLGATLSAKPAQPYEDEPAEIVDNTADQPTTPRDASPSRDAPSPKPASPAPASPVPASPAPEADIPETIAAEVENGPDWGSKAEPGYVL